MSPSDSLNLIDEYPDADVNWFVGKLTAQVQEQRIVDKLEFVNNLIIANGAQTKKGNIYYAKWRRQNVEAIEKMNTEETVFQKLKSNKDANNVFNKLKKYSGR